MSQSIFPLSLMNRRMGTYRGLIPASMSINNFLGLNLTTLAEFSPLPLATNSLCKLLMGSSQAGYNQIKTRWRIKMTISPICRLTLKTKRNSWNKTRMFSKTTSLIPVNTQTTIRWSKCTKSIQRDKLSWGRNQSHLTSQCSRARWNLELSLLSKQSLKRSIQSNLRWGRITVESKKKKI